MSGHASSEHNVKSGPSGLDNGVHFIRPSDKLAPSGYSDNFFIRTGDTLAYTIRFENQHDASGPASLIVISDALDIDLDLATFELTEIASAGRTIPVPEGLDHYRATVLFDANGTPILVDVDAALDPDTRTFTLTLTALDPDTGWIPDDPFVGLLYPNDDSGRGEGHVSFTVRPRAGLPSGAAITNRASIVFDTNDPILTPEVLNTLDAGTPASHVLPLPATTTDATLDLRWTGQDEANGSGIAGYDLYVFIDGGPPILYFDGTPETSARFPVSYGHTYAFSTVATDHVGHREPAPATPDAVVTAISPLSLDPGPDRSAPEGSPVGLPDALITYLDDPANLTLTIDWGDGTVEPGTLDPVDAGLAIADTHRYADDGSYTVTLTATEAGTGRSATDTLLVTVSNAPPVIAPIADRQAAVGSRIDLSFAYSDPGTADTHAVSWAIRDPGGSVVARGSGSDVSYVPPDDGTYTLSTTVTDDGGGRASDTALLNIHDVAPSLTPPADPSTVEGAEASFSLGRLTDPGPDGPWTVTIAWGDGSTSVFDRATPGPIAPLAHRYRDDGTYRVSLSAIDADGVPGDSATFAVLVSNAAPTATITAPADGREAPAGEPLDLVATLSDAGRDDTHSATWTIRSDALDAPVSLPGTLTNGTITATYVPPRRGRYTISLVVADDDGAEATDDVSIPVAPRRPAPADYDGDGLPDLAAYIYDAAAGIGRFEIRQSSDGATRVELLGGEHDIPITGDFDGDGKADVAVFHPEFDLNGDGTADAGAWTILYSSTGERRTTPFGAPGVLDRPAPADYDGDGITDIATFRPDSDLIPGAAEWFILRSRDGALRVQFGAAGGVDLPTPADYDGDGIDDIGTFRPISDLVPGASQWFILPSETNRGYPLTLGVAGDLAAPADYDGDGIPDPTVFAPSSGRWTTRRSSDGRDEPTTFGPTGGVPVLAPLAFRLAATGNTPGVRIIATSTSIDRPGIGSAALRAASLDPGIAMFAWLSVTDEPSRPPTDRGRADEDRWSDLFDQVLGEWDRFDLDG